MTICDPILTSEFVKFHKYMYNLIIYFNQEYLIGFIK